MGDNSMRRKDLLLMTCLLGSSAVLLGQGAIAQVAEPGPESAIDPVEKYPGFAEGNPDLIDTRGNGIPYEGPPATEQQVGTDDVERYPDPVAEDNPDLGPNVPDSPPPYSDETDVHGAFDEGNPDLSR